MRGRKTIPTNLKVLRITAKKAEKLMRKVTATPGPLVDPPEWFEEGQKTAWHYAIENAPVQVLRRIDKSILAAFIFAEDLHRKACLAMQKEELLVSSPKGYALQNPYLPIINRQTMLMLRAASELGFTPCSRARIDAGKPAQPVMGSDWEDVG